MSLKKLESLLAAVLMVLVVGCAGTPMHEPAAPSLPPEAYMPAGASWVGKWHTSFGKVDILRMNRSASGADYGGAYEREEDGVLIKGVFTASSASNTMLVQWVENRDGMNVVGRAMWRMHSDGLTFSGMWGLGTSASDGGRWEGRRDDPNRPAVAIMR